MIIQGDALAELRKLPSESVHCCVTSPPYFGLRDYGFEGQIGLERTPEEYVSRLVEVFREVRRVLRDDGVLWLNLGDSYAGSWGNAGGQNRGNGHQRPITNGSMVKDQAERNGDFVPPGKYGFSSMGIKPKDLIGIPWRVAFALQADGWYLRSDIIWHKPNPMPESVTDRCTKAHEYVFMLTKSAKYFYDNEAVKEPITSEHSLKRYAPGQAATQWGIKNESTMNRADRGRKSHVDLSKGRNRRDVWTITTKPYKGAHFATMPPDLVEVCIKAGTSERGCCPICGAPWVRVVRAGELSGEARIQTGPRPHADATGRSASSILRTNGRTWREHIDLGFRPSCGCGADPVPCTVLDPFAGSGTTGAVAKSLGRDYILIEANPDYIQLIEERVGEVEAPPLTLTDFAPVTSNP